MCHCAIMSRTHFSKRALRVYLTLMMLLDLHKKLTKNKYNWFQRKFKLSDYTMNVITLLEGFLGGAILGVVICKLLS